MPAVTRRAVLGLTGTAVFLSGCSLQVRTTTTAATKPVPRDADLPAAREAIALTNEAIASIEATIRAHPELTAPLTATLAMHRAHLTRLRTVSSAKTETAPTAPVVPAGPEHALSALWAGEDVRRTRLAVLAQNARSGAFARALASMAAAIGQRVAVSR